MRKTGYGFWLTLLALPALLFPQMAFAGEPANANAAPPVVGDLSLDAAGGILGVVVDTKGQPSQGVVVRVSGRGAQVDATTNEQGRFYVRGLKGGTYQFSIGQAVAIHRVWSANTAPPAAKSALLLQTGNEIQRGQRPVGEIFSNPLLITALIAAALAIPIAVNGSKNDTGNGS